MLLGVTVTVLNFMLTSLDDGRGGLLDSLSPNSPLPCFYKPLKVLVAASFKILSLLPLMAGVLITELFSPFMAGGKMFSMKVLEVLF